MTFYTFRVIRNCYILLLDFVKDQFNNIAVNLR